MKTLSIGIPVFNEIRFLPKLIGHLENLKNEFKSKIEIIFIDNLSTDGTREFLNDLRYHEQYRDFKIILNKENEGFNFSCDKLMSSAETEYLWIIGAQDIIYIEGLRKLLDLIDTKDPVYVICNARMRDEATNKIINESLWADIKSTTFNNIDSFFKNLGGPCQAVSCNIFKTGLISKTLDKELISHYWGYFERICDMLISNNSHTNIIFVSEPLIEILIEADVVSASGVSLFGKVPRRDYGPFYTSLELAEIANYKFSKNDGIKKSFTIFRDPFAIPRCFVVAKTKGLKLNLRLFQRLVKAYKKSISFWVLGIPILLSPKYINLLFLQLKPIIHFLRRILGIREF